MKEKTISSTIFMSISLSFFLVGCGGGSNGSSSTAQSSEPSTYSITGTVPGTIIEAYCSDGNSYSTNSINDGTSKHPFALELPANSECKLVMITNETAENPADYIITPIEFESNSNSGTYVKLDKDINLGYISLDTPDVNVGWTPGVKTPLKLTINEQALTVRSLSSDPMDTDNDGILDIYEDDDEDSLPNKYDDIDNNSSTDNGTDNSLADDNSSMSVSALSAPLAMSSTKVVSKTSSTSKLPTSFTVDNGRLLGSQCAQCHGTNGTSSSGIDSIKGEDELTHEIYDDDPLMNAQAKGYTATEIIAIETWLKNIK